MITTVSLETAWLLKESGYVQEGSEFYWAIYKTRGRIAVLYRDNPPDAYDIGDCIAAPTTDELLTEIPWELNGKCLVIEKGAQGWLVEYDLPYQIYLPENSLPETLAKMWLYLAKERTL